jgi:hypothetical protein
MSLTPRKRRRKGSLGSLQRGLWEMFVRHLELVETTDDPEVMMRSASTCVQLAYAYMRVSGLTDLEGEMAKFEHLAQGNGHLS